MANWINESIKPQALDQNSPFGQRFAFLKVAEVEKEENSGVAWGPVVSPLSTTKEELSSLILSF